MMDYFIYILLSYCISLLGLFGFFIWTWFQLKQSQTALKEITDET